MTNGRKCPADRIAYIDAHYGWLEYQLITRADANINRDGQRSSGAVDPLNLGLLAAKGSLYVTRPTLNTYAAKRENLVAMAKELFEVVKSGAVKIEVHQTYPLKDAAKAHADLAARKTTGSTVFLV